MVSERAELLKYKSRLKLADETLRSAWRKHAEAAKRWEAIDKMAQEVKNNSEALYNEIDDTSKAYCSLQEQHAQMQQQLTEQNAKIATVRAQKEKFRQYNQGMLRKQQGMQQRLEAAAEHIQQLKAQIANYTQDLKTRSRVAQADNTKMLQLQNALDNERTEHAMLRASKQYKADMHWIHTAGKEETLKKQMQEHRESLEELRNRLSNSQKKCKHLKKVNETAENRLERFMTRMKCEVIDPLPQLNTRLRFCCKTNLRSLLHNCTNT